MILLVVLVAVFRVVIWPMLQERIGYGVGCKVLSGVLVCRLQAVTSYRLEYCWKMKLRCDGRASPLPLSRCKVIERDRNLELRFAAEELSRAGCATPRSVEVGEVKRKRVKR
jgi:hypothetical protein